MIYTKRILSFLMSFATLMTGTSVGQYADGDFPAPASAYILAQPVYPNFPERPMMLEDDSEETWNAYKKDYDKYTNALSAFHVDGSDLTTEEKREIFAFAAKSTPLVLTNRKGENTVYSPLSLWSAMAMLAQCANGSSRQQVLNALGVDSVDSLQKQASHIWRTMYTDDGQSSLILGNSIWLDSNAGGTYVQDTLDALAQKYFAGAYSVPMGIPETDQVITNWVKEQTNGLVGNDDPVVQTDPQTLVLLASSLYYKSAWIDEFSKTDTQEDTFTDAAGKESKVDFMYKSQDSSFLRRDGYQAAALNTYLGEIIFVLPDESVSPESLLQDPNFLTGLELQDTDSIWGEVQWSIPKFDVDSDMMLNALLSSMGVTDLLDENKADLSAITNLNAYISAIKQLTRIKVDEEGVEAAAVTIISDVPTSSIPDPNAEICVMDLDRPFLFVIRIKDVPLFVGVVNQVQ